MKTFSFCFLFVAAVLVSPGLGSSAFSQSDDGSSSSGSSSVTPSPKCIKPTPPTNPDPILSFGNDGVGGIEKGPGNFKASLEGDTGNNAAGGSNTGGGRLPCKAK